MQTTQIKRLEELCNIMAVSSEETAIANYLKELYQASGFEIIKDRLGSTFALKKSKNENAKTLLIATSLDEVGLMISRINPNGHLEFIALEALAPVSLLHQRVNVYTRDNEALVGVISANVSAMSNLESIKMSDLYIDLGEKELAKKILPGDLVSLDNSFNLIDGHIVMAKALNNRLLLEASLEILENLKDVELDYNLVIGGIAASIVGHRGTMTSAYVVKPDAAIALAAFDINNSKTKLNRGDKTVIAFHDGGMLPSLRMLNDVKGHFDTFQTSVGTMANDASFIHKMLSGCPTVAMGVAMNNCGSPNVIADLNDVDHLVTNLSEYCKTLNSSKIANFGFED